MRALHRKKTTFFLSQKTGYSTKGDVCGNEIDEEKELRDERISLIRLPFKKRSYKPKKEEPTQNQDGKIAVDKRKTIQ